MKSKTRRQLRAAVSAVLDLFSPQPITVPAPATMHTRILEEGREVAVRATQFLPVPKATALPSAVDLYAMFDRFNLTYFAGSLPRVTILYSERMSSAGSYTPRQKLIRIGRKYHEIFPEEIADTLKHEMIHIKHFKHNAAFKREAKRVGASVQANYHPSLHKAPRFVYACPTCGKEYNRQKVLRMASCGDCTKGKRFDPRYKLVRKKNA